MKLFTLSIQRLSVFATVALYLLISNECLAKDIHRINIATQAEFEKLDTLLKRSLESRPDSISIVIAPGNYYYNESHINLTGVRAERTSISLSGENVSLYPHMHKGERFNCDSSFYSVAADTPSLIIRRDTIRMAKSLVRIVDKKKKICKIKIQDPPSPLDINDSYIYLTEWYRGRNYKIIDVKGDFVYFIADDLKQARFLYNVNLDWTFSLQRPRYKLVHCSQNEEEDKGACAEATNFISFVASFIGRFNCSGLSFIGNNHNLNDRYKSLIYYYSSTVRSSFTNCEFCGIKSDCFYINGSEDITVQGCRFHHNYRYCLQSDNASKNISFIKNRIHESGLSGDNVFAVLCNGENFNIIDNVISDYGYGAIRSGVHYTSEKKYPVCGYVTGNEIFQTKEYFDAAPNTLLMDSGAIYISTQNDDVRIEGNYIHDINGPTYNRGIFADDGTSHVHIMNNRVENIKNYYGLDIDPRSAWKLKLAKRRKFRNPHEGIEVSGNEVIGRVRVSRKIRRLNS